MLRRGPAHSELAPWATRERLFGKGFTKGCASWGMWRDATSRSSQRWSDGSPDRLPALARELAALKLDVIVASSTQAIRAAEDATTVIPVVMVLASFPDKVGLIESLARPGGNVTGLSTLGPQLMAKRVELLKEIVPERASRVALLFDPANPVESLAMRELMAATEAAGIKVLTFAARTPEEVVTSLAAAASSGADALWAFGNPANFKGRQLIADAARKNRLPSMFDEGIFVEAGGLVAYGPSYYDQFRRAASLCRQASQRRETGQVTREQPMKFELSLNQTTARTLGLAIPPSVLLRADRIIE